MFSVWMILAAIAILSISGLPACLLSARSSAGQRLTTLFMLLGAIVGVCGIAASLSVDPSPSLHIAWVLPWGAFAVAVDPISAIFLGPVFVVPALGSIYGLGYWKQSEHQENGRWLGFFFGLLAGSMALVCIARDGVLFLMAWEIMALAAYFALVTEDANPQVRQVAWVYFIATHVGTLCLFALFALWRHITGSFALEPAQAIPQQLAGVLFVLALIGFGLKAGLMPLHVWLPGAHANAPSHLSAVMSAVLLKTGIYGIVRVTALLPAPDAWCGALLLIAGAITGIAGIAFALGQHDIKRLLAYSSIENIGIIAIGIGLALLGRTFSRPEWILLGLGGALLHVWNHALFKSMLFLNAGSIIHAVHTRDMNHLGGLARRMPRTAALFVVGAIAICALPPLNGFASEWLIYLGLFRTLDLTGPASFAAVAAVALATIGALAVACFIKLLATVLLGSPRTDATDHAHDPPASMTAPMLFLAAVCVLLGLFPLITAPLLQRAAQTWVGSAQPIDLPLAAIAPLSWLTTLGLTLFAIVGAVWLLLRLLPRAHVIEETGTWDCGYAQPTARMQYTGSSFAQSLVNLLSWLLWPRRIRSAVDGLFAGESRHRTDTPDLVLDRGLIPAASMLLSMLPWVRRLQQGRVHTYLLYVLAIVVLLFLIGF
jgi:hydrogenase-4 component B